jgi:hypothetical protein
MHLEALEHLFFNVFDVGEPAPTIDIAAITTGTRRLPWVQMNFGRSSPMLMTSPQPLSVL